MGKLQPVVTIIQRPRSEDALRKLAEKALNRAAVQGVLPTPIDQLIAAAELDLPADPEHYIQGFIGGLTGAAKSSFLSAIQKVRGIADLREKAIYIPKETSDRRRRFVQGHELGHQEIPWHKVNAAYRDDDVSLRLVDAPEEFDQEANFFSAEIIFQGHRFTARARNYRASFESAFQLADDHGASRHATLWRFVEEQDETLGLLTYWPSQYMLDSEGYPILRRGKGVGSPRFCSRFSNLEVPTQITGDHPWAAARSVEIAEGEIALICDGTTCRFQWQAWWNTYSLFVLLRRRPLLHVVGKIFRRSE